MSTVSDFDTRAAAYAVVVRGGEVLLSLWNEGPEPVWTLPGGGLDLRESCERAAVREVAEETGYDVALTALLGVDTRSLTAAERVVPADRALLAVRVVYAADVVGGELRPEVGGSTDEARWWPLDQVARLPRVPLVDVGLGFWRAAGSA